MELEDVLEKYIDQNKLYSTEGEKGYVNLCKIVYALGYDNLKYFLEDNSGAIEAIITFIEDNMNDEWAAGISANEHD